jgi:hypothetical protein
MQEVPILFFRHGHALEHKDQGTTRGANIDGLVGSVQHEDGRKQSMAVPGPVRGRWQEQARSVPGYWVVIEPK